MEENIDVLIKILQRLKGQPRTFQEDALWKLGDLLTEAVDEQKTLDAEEVFRALQEYHARINQMAEEMGDDPCT